MAEIAGSYRYANDITTPYASMASATSLNDVAEDDDTTGPTEASAPLTVPPPACGNARTEITAYQQAVFDAGSVHDITDIRATGRARHGTSGLISQCIDPAGATVSDPYSEIYYSSTGMEGDWTLLQTDAVTASVYDTVTWTGTIQARYIRRRLVARFYEDYQSGSFLSYAQNTDLRVFGEPVTNDCGLPVGVFSVTQGTTAHFTTDGTTAPSIDEWEIYRCIDNVLTLIDSSDLGTAGLSGWIVSVSSVPGYSYDIYAPLDAPVGTDYEARIDRGASNHSVNFNVIAGAAVAVSGPQRPLLFEEYRYSFQSDPRTPVRAALKDPALKMTVPDPVEPSTQVNRQGGDGVVSLIPHKGHTAATVSGPAHFMGLIDQFYLLLGEPYIKPVAGSSLSFDTCWMINSDQQCPAARATIEQGQPAYPARFDSYEHESATLTFGKTENTVEFAGIGRRLDERLTAFSVSEPAQIPFIPTNAARNNHYLGTAPAYWGVGTAPIGCDLHEATLTLPQRRQPLFTQSTGDGKNTWKNTIRIASVPALSIALSHRQISRGQIDYIRNKTAQIYQFLNRSDESIEPGYPYELEIVMNVQADDRGPGDTDGVTTGVHNFVPVKTSVLDPWGIGTPAAVGIRIRSTHRTKPAGYPL